MSFDRVASYYRRLESLVFGEELQKARCAFVRQLEGGAPSRPRMETGTTPRSPLQRALVIGEGDGRFLEALRHAQPGLPVECLDASARMLALARARVGDTLVQFIEADIREAAFPGQRYDLIVTHFFLDCFEEAALRAVVEKLSAAAAGEATWLIADFQKPRRAWARLLVAAMYLFFRIAAGIEARRLVDYAPFLQAQGFALTGEVISPNEMVRSQRWERRAVRPDRS